MLGNNISLECFKLAIVVSHPVQYTAPWFRLLSQHDGIRLKVFYTWSQSQKGAKYDPGFDKIIEWDIPLLDGYDYEFVNNVSNDPGSHHYKGIDNPTLNKDITEWDPGAIIIIGWAFKSHLSCMRYFKGKVPILFRGDSTLLDEQPGLRTLLRRVFLKYVYSFVDYALYVGTNNKKYFLKHGLKEDQLYFAPHAIDNDRFENATEENEVKAQAWRNELNITDNQFVILYAGKLEPVKDLEFILELADNISSQDLRIIFVGNGPIEKDLKAKAKQDKRIIFLDFQNQKTMPVVYQLCNIFIMPSKSETWGLAINEAMACAKPVIASDKVGCAVDLVHNNNGYVIKDRNVKTTAAFIEEIKQKNIAGKMGNASREIIRSYSFSEIVNTIGSVISHLKYQRKGT